MMKKENNVFRIEDCVVRVVRLEGDYIIFEITGRERGFKTTFRISKSDFRRLANSIYDAKCISTLVVDTIIKDIHAKHREYTMIAGEETEMTYKYYESRNSIIYISARGGHCIVCLTDGKDKVFRTISFEVQKHVNGFKRLSKMLSDMSMYQF
jgi:hypothetical protein